MPSLKEDLKEKGWKILKEGSKIYAKRVSTEKQAVFFPSEPDDQEISKEYSLGFHPFEFTIEEKEVIYFDMLSKEFVKEP